MNLRCGIDLGTTYSAISWYDDDNHRLEVIDLNTVDGNRLLPSIVFFESGGNIIVGETAVTGIQKTPERVITAIKRSMGEEYRTQEIDGKSYTPQEVSAEILKVLKTDAQPFLGKPLKDVVISVPAYFGDRERQATIEAAELAGLNVLELIPEPHAAALAFAIDRVRDVENRNLLVYDLGGGTFDVTLIKTEKEVSDGGTGLRIQTLAKEGNRRLGGLDWDTALARVVADRVVEEYGIEDPFNDPKTEAALLSECQVAKRHLSKLGSYAITVEGKEVDISRTDFEAQTGDLVLQTEALLKQVLREAEEKHKLYTKKRIDELGENGTGADGQPLEKVRLLLCGGATRMPMVKDMVTRIMGEDPLTHKNADLLVAMGTAYRAYLLGGEGETKKPVIETGGSTVELLPGGGDTGKAIGVEVIDVDQSGQVVKRENDVIIKAGTPYGEVFEKKFGTAFHGMTEIPLVFYEGDSPDLSECTRLADVLIEGLPPDRPAGKPVTVRLWYDGSGIVCGQAIDVESKKNVEIKIQRWSQ